MGMLPAVLCLCPHLLGQSSAAVQEALAAMPTGGSSTASPRWSPQPDKRWARAVLPAGLEGGSSGSRKEALGVAWHGGGVLQAMAPWRLAPVASMAKTPLQKGLANLM